MYPLFGSLGFETKSPLKVHFVGLDVTFRADKLYDWIWQEIHGREAKKSCSLRVLSPIHGSTKCKESSTLLQKKRYKGEYFGDA